MDPVSTETHTVLRSQNEWLAFLRQVKGVAERIGYWSSIDPSQPEEKAPRPKAQPTAPSLKDMEAAQDDDEELRRLELRVKIFTITKAEWDTWRRNEDRILAVIDKTTSA